MKAPTNKLRVLLFILTMGISPMHASQENKGKTAGVLGSFFQSPSSIRLAALGGDQTAAQGEGSGLFSNPAGLHSIAIPELWLNHNQSFKDMEFRPVQTVEELEPKLKHPSRWSQL